MLKINFDLPNLSKKSWIALMVMVILLISLPFGIFLSQQTQIFKPRANESISQSSIPPACGSGPISLTTICTNNNPQGLIITFRGIPETAGCNVFIRDHSTGDDYSISKHCDSSMRLLRLHDLDGIKPDTDIKPNVQYTLFVSNGEACFNQEIVTTTTQCAAPTMQPSDPFDPKSYFKEVKGWNQQELHRYRSLGFYPVQEPNGDIDLLTRKEYVEYICNDNDACVPKESLTLNTTKNDSVFLKNLMAKLFENGFAPIPALRPYFMSDIDDLITLNANSDVLKAFQSGEYKLIGVPLLNTSQDQFRTVITETELLKFIKEVARSDEYRNNLLYKYENELRADEEWPILNVLLDSTDTVFGTRSAVTFFAIAPDQQSLGTRLKHSLGVISVLFPGIGKGAEVVVKPALVKAIATAKIISSKRLVETVEGVAPKVVGDVQALPLTTMQTKLKEAEELADPIVGAAPGPNVRFFLGAGPIWGRLNIWGNVDHILGPVPALHAGTYDVAFIEPVESQAAEYLQFFNPGDPTRSIKYALNQGDMSAISWNEILRPTVENILRVADVVSSRLNKKIVSDRARDLYLQQRDQNLVFVAKNVNSTGVDASISSAGWAVDNLIVYTQKALSSAEAFLIGLAHEKGHGLHFSIAAAEGRPKLIGFEYIPPNSFAGKKLEDMTRDEIGSVFYEAGEDVVGIRAFFIRRFPDGTIPDEEMIKNSGYLQGFPQFYDHIMDQDPIILDYLCELALTGDFNTFLRQGQGLTSFQAFLNTNPALRQAAPELQLVQFFRSKGIDLVPIGAASGTSLAVAGAGIYVTNAKPAGSQLDYSGFSGSSISLVKNIFLNYNIAGRGGSPDILGRTTPTGFTLDKNTLCSNNKLQEYYIGVRYANSPSNGSGDAVIRIRFKLSDNVRQAICANSSSGAGGAAPIPSPSPIVTTIEKPTIIDGSCNRTTLNLSWNQVDGINKYQMRGRKTNDEGYYPTLNSKIDGPVDPNYTTTLDLSDSAKEVLSNSDGSGVSCFGGKCAYSFSGLKNTFKYRVWVNSKDDSGNRSDNSYFPSLVDCNYQEPGNRNDMVPVITNSSCTNGKVKLEWEVTQTAGPFKGVQPTEHKYHVRGLQTDDSNYFPPNNWTDGINPNRYLSNNNGDNVKCEYGTNPQGYGYAKCSYTDDQSIQRTGTYRLWVDSFIPGKDNSRSVNTYNEGLVTCQ